MTLSFSNAFADLLIGSDGSVRSLVERRTGREWASQQVRVPLFTAVVSDVSFSPTQFRYEAGLFQIEFGQINFTCLVRCESGDDHFLFKVESVTGALPDTLFFFGMHLASGANSHYGRYLNTLWDEAFSVTLLALTMPTEARSLPTQILQVRAHKRFSLEGAACALLTVPTPDLDRKLVELAGRYGLPTPTLDGQPAKLSPMVRRGYMLTNMSATDADQVLEWAKRGQLRHVVINAESWHDRYGHYRVHPGKFPGSTFKDSVERFHQAGIGVGLHLSSASIGWEDPYITPVPDRRLVTGARFKLESAVEPADRWLHTQAHPLMVTRRVLFDYKDFGPNTAALGAGDADDLGTVYVQLENEPCTVRVDDELMRVRHNLQGMGFEVLERGLHGTSPGKHAAGAEIAVLRQLYGAFLLDVYSTLLEEVADSVAAIYNQCGLDMIYFDCMEGGQGPAWHARAQLHSEFLRRFNRECLVQGSDYPHASWHRFSRYGTSDCVPTCANTHTDHTRIPRVRSCIDNRMPADMGWFQIYSETERHPATQPAEVAHLCECAENLNACISLQTTVQEMSRNPQTKRILDIVAQHEKRAT